MNNEDEEIFDYFSTVFDNILNRDKSFDNRVKVSNFIGDLFDFCDSNELFDQMLPDLKTSIKQNDDLLLSQSSFISLSKMSLHSEYIEREFLCIALTQWLDESISFLFKF
jgi:hypothetical protein